MKQQLTKSKQALRQTFLELRRRRTLRDIRVNELCALADVSKGTFYRNYEDVYALQKELEDELIAKMAGEINAGHSIYDDQDGFFGALDRALNRESNLLLEEALFRGEYERMMMLLEEELKKTYLSDENFSCPEYIRLSYVLGGAFGIYIMLHCTVGVTDMKPVCSMLAELTRRTMKEDWVGLRNWQP